MSSKRMLGIAVFGAAFIALFIGVMLLASYLQREPDNLTLPSTEITDTAGAETNNPTLLKSVEITKDNVQAVIGTLSRPDNYAREITIESFWDDGNRNTVYKINTAARDGITSLTASGGGAVRRVIVTRDTLYTWNEGDAAPFIRELGDSGDWRREADEWQMLPTYEDILDLPKNAIIDAGYERYGDEDCIYVACKSARLGYMSRYYISVALGLLVGIEEFESGAHGAPLTYRMTSGACTIGKPDETAFLLPDGSSVISGP